MKSDNYTKKYKILKDILKDIGVRKRLHYKKYKKYKRNNTICKGGINCLNAISVSSIVLTFTPVSPIFMVVALTSNTISGITTAILNAIEIENKIHSHNTSYLQYSDLYRNLQARIRKNGISSEDLDGLLCELNEKLGLIEDQSLPIDCPSVNLDSLSLLDKKSNESP